MLKTTGLKDQTSESLWNLEHHQNVISASLAHYQCFPENVINFQNVHNFWSYAGEDQTTKT